MKALSTKEPHALATLATTGAIDWGRTHANTVAALHRKGLIVCTPAGKRVVTPNGRAALAAIPNIFDDLFTKEDPPVTLQIDRVQNWENPTVRPPQLQGDGPWALTLEDITQLMTS